MVRYAYYNPNPYGRRVDDCAVRAVSAALGSGWDTAYDLLVENGRDAGEVMAVMDELMTATAVYNPRLYAATLRRFRE